MTNNNSNNNTSSEDKSLKLKEKVVTTTTTTETEQKEKQEQTTTTKEDIEKAFFDVFGTQIPEFTNGDSKSKKKKQKVKTAESEEEDKEKSKPRRITTFKYSQMGIGELYESVFIAGFPAFIYYNSDKKQFERADELEEITRILAPPTKEECPYLPYEFANLKEINESSKLIEDKNIGLDYFYYKGLEIVSKYNVQSKYKLRLVTINLIASYFQDRFATVHYLYPVGGNGSGKSSLAETFRAIAYRAVVMTDPTAPNLFRLLGVVEPAQCVIILEEADKIDKSSELMAVLKTGYSYSGHVPKINPYTLKQEFFFTYCPKIIVSERSLNHSIAKGVNSRTFPLNCFKGIANRDIKETLNPTDTGGPDNKELLQEIMNFRKLLLVYRLKHFKDPIPDLDIGVEGRDKELVKYCIQLFYRCKCQKQVTDTLQKFLDIKNEKKNSAIEAILLPIIHSLVNKNQITQIPSDSIWEELIKEIPGIQNEKKPNEFHSYDYGTLYSTTISGIICDSFGAKIKHGNRRNFVVFDPEIIENLSKEDVTRIEVKGIKKSEGVKGMKGSERGTYDISTLLDEEEETEINDNDDDDDDSNSDKNEDLPPSNDSTAFMPSLSTPEDKEEEI